VAFAAAWVDGSICDEEKQALHRVLLHLGYEPDEIAARLESTLEGPKLDTIERPKDLAVGLEMMRYALAVTLADGSLARHEVDFLVQLTAHLGLSKQALAILKLEAENLVGQADVPGLSSIVDRVEALLPDQQV
jgi:uncharacterized membrane protein YebE (DUF533 family)